MRYRCCSGPLALLVSLMLVGAVWAQDLPAARQKKTRPDFAALETRITQLENQLAKLTKELQDRQTDRKAPAVAVDKIRIQFFVLKYAEASGLAKALQNLFPEKDGLTLRITSEPNLNVVLVRGSHEELELVVPIISELDKTAQDRIRK